MNHGLTPIHRAYGDEILRQKIQGMRSPLPTIIPTQDPATYSNEALRRAHQNATQVQAQLHDMLFPSREVPHG